MPPKRKRPSILDAIYEGVREQLRRLSDELGPLLSPESSAGQLQPRTLPVRVPKPKRKK